MIARYCLPPTSNVIGGALIPLPRLNVHSSCVLSSSWATTRAVAQAGERIGDDDLGFGRREQPDPTVQQGARNRTVLVSGADRTAFRRFMACLPFL
jgi:hypothetical protein